MANTRQLLEELQDSTDLALDFIEHEIGGNAFARNWKIAKQRINVEDMVAKWMAKIGAVGNPQQIVKVIDELADHGTQWLTPFTSPIPPEDAGLPSSKQKSRR
jgi:hypothetical protein